MEGFKRHLGKMHLRDVENKNKDTKLVCKRLITKHTIFLHTTSFNAILSQFDENGHLQHSRNGMKPTEIRMEPQ